MSCSGRHTLRVTGVSNLDFRAGFSSVPVAEFNHTRERPVKGAGHVSFRVSHLTWSRTHADDDIMMSSFLPPRSSNSHSSEMHRLEASWAAQPGGTSIGLRTPLAHHPSSSALWPRWAGPVEPARVTHPLPELLYQGNGQRRGGLPLPEAVQCLLHQHRSV